MLCRNKVCGAEVEIDKWGMCPECGGYHRDLDTMLYTPWRDERARKAEEERRERVTSMRRILRDHVRDLHKPWFCMEFAKAAVGNMFLAALADLGCDPKEELSMAVEEAGR